MPISENLDDPTKFKLEYLSLVLSAVSPKAGRSTWENWCSITTAATLERLRRNADIWADRDRGTLLRSESARKHGRNGKHNPLPPSRQENIEARYELLGRGTYSSTNTHIQNAIFGIDRKTPRALFEARNAVRIAHIAAADKYANWIIGKAEQQLRQAEEADGAEAGQSDS